MVPRFANASFKRTGLRGETPRKGTTVMVYWPARGTAPLFGLWKKPESARRDEAEFQAWEGCSETYWSQACIMTRRLRLF